MASASTTSLSSGSSEPHGDARLLNTRAVLVLGFSLLLSLLLLSGLNAIHALSTLQTSNETTLREFLAKEGQLNEIRAALYLSGTYVRDYLLESDAAKAEQSRGALADARSRIESLLAESGAPAGGAEREMFGALQREIRDYWLTLEPVLSWSMEQRRRLGFRFLTDEVFPRRSTTLGIADTIQSMNQQQLMRRDERLLAMFSSVRDELLVALVAMLLVGVILAFFSTAHILRLEKQTLQNLRAATEARQALQSLSAKLVTTQEDERKNISRELHDAVGQSLSAVQFELHDLAVVLPGQPADWRQRINRIREMVEGSAAMVRNMALLLRPSMLDDLGLAAALEWQAREVSRPTGLRIQVRADGVPDWLPDEHKTCVFRIVQEALNNVCKHANANSVEITLHVTDPWLVVTVQDDGRGFRPDRTKGLGLAGIEERVESLGGSLRITSGPGKGTLIEVALPLPPRLPASAVSSGERAPVERGADDQIKGID